MGTTASQEESNQSASSADASREPLLARQEQSGAEPPQERPTYASISVEQQSRDRSAFVTPFWVPRFEPSEQQYYIVKVPKRPKPRMAWRAPRPFIIYDYILSVLFVVLAVRLIQPDHDGDDISVRAIISVVLFQASLVASTMVLYAIFTTCGRKCFQWQDLLIIIAMGISIYLNKSLKHPWKLPNMSKGATWKLFTGISLLEAVAIYTISRGLFLFPSKDDTIDMLQNKVASWECSTALGLTDAYFECIQQVGRVVKQAADHRVQVTYQNPGESRDEDSTRLSDEMLVPCIFVAVPRYADWTGGSPSPPLRRDFVRSGRLLACQIQGTPGADDSWLCVTGIRQGYILDPSPDPLTTIMNDVQSNPKFQNDVERKNQYETELHRFSQRLAWLVMREGLEKYVKVIEFESNMMQHLPISCKEVFTELQYEDRMSGDEAFADEEAGSAGVESSS